VLKTEVGYCGGHTINPDYETLCQGNTGHYEAIRVVYDPKVITYEALARYFFEIHNPTQTNGQGPDYGEQYLSVGFYYDVEQEQTLKSLINRLNEMGIVAATKILPVSPFWRAEEYHQDYYHKTQKTPYCHHYQKKFT